MFQKLLVVNRGEIARRIFLACRELGIRSVAITSEPDADAAWATLADEVVPLAGSSAAETYLNQSAIFRVVEETGVDAIHPGYGFLSENADFAEACERRGLTFVGPSAAAMRLLGSKAAARQLAEQADVPTVPGVDGAGLSSAELRAAAESIGYPVLIKASAGGGGKGMRVVANSAEFDDALQAARQEAASAFGDDHVLVEKYFTKIHHIEIQVLGDSHGNLLHLFERECSIQRRHQKIIEESPSPTLGDNDTLRQAIADSAVRLAQAANYVNAGTVEFIVDESGGFYFLEMNTRLQVEHPVTEMVTGLDLVNWQLRIAAGEKLTLSQADVAQRGHAFECRIYAEDPAVGFLPSTGELAVVEWPAGPNVRVDGGVATGSAVTPYYDPMLAKLITWGHDREEARAKMMRALQDTVVLGVQTNLSYLLAILAEPHFVAGDTPTSYLSDHFAGWQPTAPNDDLAWLAAAAFEALKTGGKSEAMGSISAESPAQSLDPWRRQDGWRNV